MSQAEKRYFQIYGSKRGEGEKKIYLRLFEAILDQESHNEAALKEVFAGESWLKQFAATKHYLHKMILRSLRAFHHENHHENWIHARLEEIRILSSRELYPQAMKVLLRLKKKAEKMNASYYWPVIHRWERQLIQSDSKKSKFDRIKASGLEEKAKMASLRQEIELRDLYSQTFLLTQQTLQGHQENQQEMLEKVHFALEQVVPSKLDTFRGQLTWHFTQAFYQQLRQERELAKDQYRIVLALWEAHPAQIVDDLRGYAHSLVDYLNICHATQQYQEFDLIIGKIRNLQGLNLEMKARMFRMTFNLELIYYINTNQLESALALVPVLEVAMNKYQDRIDKISIFSYSYNIAILLFIMERFKEARTWVVRLLEFDKADARRDVQRFVQLFQLMVQHELGNAQLLAYMLPGVRRKLRNAAKLNQFELCLLEFFRKVKDQPKASQMGLFQELADNLEALPPLLKSSPGWQESNIWAKGRAQNRPLKSYLTD